MKRTLATVSVVWLARAAAGAEREGAQTVAETPTRAQADDGRWISWREHVIDDEAKSGVALRGGDGLAIADLDEDGFDDIVSVHEDSNHVRIAFGTANPDDWKLVSLADGEEALAPEDVSIADANGDGGLTSSSLASWPT